MQTMLKWGAFVVMGVMLLGCTHHTGLSNKQVKVIEEKGFKHTDEGWSLNLPSRLLFETGSAETNPEHEESLAQLVKTLNYYLLPPIKVVGHTDNVGTEADNQLLSEQRAQAIANILIKHGYDPQRLQVIGRGMTQPLVDNDTEENRAENRRVTIVIVQ